MTARSQARAERRCSGMASPGWLATPDVQSSRRISIGPYRYRSSCRSCDRQAVGRCADRFRAPPLRSSRLPGSGDRFTASRPCPRGLPRRATNRASSGGVETPRACPSGRSEAFSCRGRSTGPQLNFGRYAAAGGCRPGGPTTWYGGTHIATVTLCPSSQSSRYAMSKEQRITRQAAEDFMAQIRHLSESGAQEAIVNALGSELVFTRRPAGGFTFKAPGQPIGAIFQPASESAPSEYPDDVPFIPDEPLTIATTPGSVSLMWWAPADPERLFSDLSQSTIAEGWELKAASEFAHVPARHRQYESTSGWRSVLLSDGMVTLIQRH